MEVNMKKADNCPVEATLELIGGKYKALILWHLSETRLRFSELRKVISSATPKMLTQQLRELEAQGLIHREVYPIIPPKVEYSLTELGHSLMPVLISMRDWGITYLQSKNIEANCFMMQKEPLAHST
jgi:DNA-binding HxlR family transcriptional regulator